MTVLSRYGLDPSETLLLDDSEANCRSAESLGMRSVRIAGDKTFLSVAANL